MSSPLPLPGRRLPPLHLLRMFERAAAHESFRMAADELNVTPSAVSHAVKALETHLGLALFQRAPRRLHLSSAGRAYAELLRRVFSELESGTQELLSRFRQPVLRLNITPFFSGEWFIPRLHRFQARHGDIELRVETAFGRMDDHPSHADVSILLGEGDWPGLVATRLMSMSLEPVCSPSYQKNHSPLRVEDLHQHPWIRYASRLDLWDGWLDAQDLPPMTPRTSLSFDTMYAALRAAEQGLGLAMAPRPLADLWMADGRLVEPFGRPVQIEPGFWLVYRPGDADRTAVRAFGAWIREEFAGAVELSG